MTRVWQLGAAGPAASAAGAVVLTYEEAELARERGIETVLPLHEVLVANRRRVDAGALLVTAPGYRGKRFLDVLAWAASRLLQGGDVTWRFPKREARSSVAWLRERGWDVVPGARGAWPEFVADVPAVVAEPEVRTFATEWGEFGADYGVFSPERIDPGSQLLLDIALAGDRCEAIADVGIGYGGIGLSLAAAGLVAHVVGSDVDAVALWLAQRNAARFGVDIEVQFDPDPSHLPSTPLTVCNVPTHVGRAASDVLVDGLVSRAAHGRVLAVVHQSLEARYAAHFAGLRVERHTGGHHVVLDVTAR